MTHVPTIDDIHEAAGLVDVADYAFTLLRIVNEQRLELENFRSDAYVLSLLEKLDAAEAQLERVREENKLLKGEYTLEEYKEALEKK